MEHEIILKPEVLFYFQNFPITNTILVSWIAMAILIIAAIFVKLSIKMVPSNIQNFFEPIIDTAYGLSLDLAGKKASVFFPWVMTFFFFIITANWLGLLPGFATITYNNHPLLRSINSDLNMTLSLALISAFVTHFLAVKYLGVKNYLLKWVALNPIFLFVGILELVGEFTKVVSLSFRLFGNIFAGEVVLATISSMFAFILPLPFYFLEIVVGFVQAAVFAMLTLVFMSLLTEKHETSH